MKRVRSLFAWGVFLFLIFHTGASFSAEVFMSSILNNSSSDSFDYRFYAVTSQEGSVVGFRKYYFQKGTQMRKAEKSVSYGLENMGSGIVLQEQSGHRILVLKSLNFDPQQGGWLRLDYLKNGITGGRGFVDFYLSKVPFWHLKNSQGATFQNMFLQINKLFGAEVGIGSIQLK